MNRFLVQIVHRWKRFNNCQRIVKESAVNDDDKEWYYKYSPIFESFQLRPTFQFWFQRFQGGKWKLFYCLSFLFFIFIYLFFFLLIYDWNIWSLKSIAFHVFDVCFIVESSRGYFISLIFDWIGLEMETFLVLVSTKHRFNRLNFFHLPSNELISVCRWLYPACC